MNTHPELWAKQSRLVKTYPLLAHLLDTATVIGVLYDSWLRPELRDLISAELGPKARQTVQFLGGAHDAGKAIPQFQLQPRRSGEVWEEIRRRIKASGLYGPPSPLSTLITSTNPVIRRHEAWSAYALQGDLLRRETPARATWKELTVAGHHGRWQCVVGRARQIRPALMEVEKTRWAAAQSDLLAAVAAGCGISREEMPETVAPAITLLLSGLVILADRIASGEEFVLAGQEILAKSPELLATPADWIARRSAEAEKRVRETVGVYTPPWRNTEEACKKILQGHAPRPAQAEAMQSGAGLYSIMASTGSGKTEAALLRHATKNERLIFLLPTQATTNAMMARIQKIYAGTANVASLAHGLASIEDFYANPITVYDDESTGHSNTQHKNAKADAELEIDAEQSQRPSGLYPSTFVKSGASRLLAPICVGTVDQALAGALPGKWIHLRLLALANAHVVIDEVHTLDQYQTELLGQLLPWLAATGTRVTFLTATMPSWQRERLMRAYGGENFALPETEFPAVESLAESELRIAKVPDRAREIKIAVDEVPFAEMVEGHVAWEKRIRQRFPQARIGIICNTVARAQETAQLARAAGSEVVLLHSRMTAEHRRVLTERLHETVGAGSAGSAITVVGTQVIEASLDIDLDFMRTELCPAPSLIQRLGRLWRREDPLRAERAPGQTGMELSLAVIEDPEAWKVRPYLKAELTRTVDWIRPRGKLVLPENAQEFVDAAAVSLEDAVTADDEEAVAEQIIQAMKAGNRKARIADLLTGDPQAGSFEALTVGLPKDESSTRLIDDSDQYQLIMGGDPDAVPGAWQGTAEELQRLPKDESRQTIIRAALKASITVRIKQDMFAQLCEEGSLESLSDSKSVLAGYYLLRGAERFYSPEIGYVGLEGGTGEDSSASAGENHA
ncbi:hypothetical protein ACU19_05120 [Actinobaculum suis]|uniref:CRISPR-associated helicase/endonuclease Cas3 n=1 Tax=Actinobaculum suis TaxID=1657 RepID=UPI0006A004F9|nr:CRISPR-associated helicase/endonuclease Cas3 [Actinobaculum suis]KMY23347.1 hypothetical protein ACU19_05120 [Actinobaculum suis]